MWQTLSNAAGADPELADSTRELLRSTMRNVVLVASALYLAWHLAATVLWPSQLGPGVWAISACFAPLSLATLWLVAPRPLLAQALWQLGLAALIALAARLFQRPEAALLAALLPLMAVVTSGWAAGLLAQGLVLALVWALGQGLLGPPLAPAYAAGVIVGATVAGLLGWTAMRTFATVARWSFFSYAKAQEHAEEAQQHRARLAAIVKDLDQAYYRLERSNTALVAARKAAEEAERFKAEFVANVSHELRTPLNLIVGFSEVMITSPESYGAPLPGPYRSDLNAIYRSAQHLLALVDDVLDLARIEAGKITLVREEVDLTGLVAEVADTMRDYISAKGLELRVQFIRGLPRELDEAAEIDGCSQIGIFLRITLPLITPALITSALFSFYWTWEDFFGPLLYLNDPKLFTVSLALRNFADPSAATNWGAIFAMSTVSLLPAFILFLLFQRYLVQGISTTGLKG